MSDKNPEQHLKSIVFNTEVRRLANDSPEMSVREAVQEADRFAAEKAPKLYRAIEESVDKLVSEQNNGPR